MTPLPCMAALGLVIALLSPACSGGNRRTDGEQGELSLTRAESAAIAQDCLDLMASYREADPETAPEAELARQMEEASLNSALCAQVLRSSYDGIGGAVMANHLARALAIHALKVELALSARFDEMAGYCAILEDLIAALQADLNEINQALNPSRPDEEDLQVILSLRELTVHSLQISLLDYGEVCR